MKDALLVRFASKVGHRRCEREAAPPTALQLSATMRLGQMSGKAGGLVSLQRIPLRRACKELCLLTLRVAERARNRRTRRPPIIWKRYGAAETPSAIADAPRGCNGKSLVSQTIR